MAMPPTTAAKDRSSITYTKQAEKKMNYPQQYGADGCATHARCYLLMVLLGGSFSTLRSARFGCAHGCVHERAKNRPNVDVTSGSGTRAKGIIP